VDVEPKAETSAHQVVEPRPETTAAAAAEIELEAEVVLPADPSATRTATTAATTPATAMAAATATATAATASATPTPRAAKPSAPSVSTASPGASVLPRQDVTPQARIEAPLMRTMPSRVPGAIVPLNPPEPEPDPKSFFDMTGNLLRDDIESRVIVTGEYRVILHSLEGHVKRGSIQNVDLSAPSFTFLGANAERETIERAKVKAIFFLMEPGAAPKPAEGARVRVTFKDGRQVAGFSRDHRSVAPGFFVVPTDHRTKTDRIFIYRHSVQTLVVDP
jgi:hypothetical protein